MAGTGESFAMEAQLGFRLDGPSSVFLVLVAVCVIAFIAEISRGRSLIRGGLRGLQALWLKLESDFGGAGLPGRAMSESGGRS